MFCRKTSYISFSQQQLLFFGIVLIGLSFMAIQGCQKDQEKIQGFSGKWKVDVAFRNGQSTSTLEDAYFDFASDSTFITNIFDSPQTYQYTLTDEGFKQMGQEEIDYVVDAQNPDTMIIQTTFKNYHFSFITTKDTSKVETIVQ